MKNYNKILVFENDSNELSYLANQVLREETVPVENWFDFNSSFYHNKEENFKRLAAIDKDTLIVSNPSFVGAENQFTGYLYLFLKLKDLNIKLDIAIVYHESFLVYLLKFLSEESNYLKKESNHKLLREVLDFHTVYEIDNKTYNIKESFQLTYERLMKHYVESHRKLAPTKFRVNETGAEYTVAYVYYHKELADTKIVLLIPDNYSNEFSFDQLTRV